MPGLVLHKARPLPISYADTFARADTTSGFGVSSGGAPWANDASCKIVSGKATPTGTSANAWYPYMVTSSPNGTAQATKNDGSDSGITFRYVDANNYWRAYLWGIALIVNGSSAAPGNVYSWGTPPPANGSVMKIVLAGSTISCYIDNTLSATITNSTFSTSVNHGLYLTASGGAGQMSNWSFIPA